VDTGHWTLDSRGVCVFLSADHVRKQSPHNQRRDLGVGEWWVMPKLTGSSPTLVAADPQVCPSLSTVH
jgi:hypothetical protein